MFEYKTIESKFLKYALDELNALGKEGWEVVETIQYNAMTEILLIRKTPNDTFFIQ